METAEGGFRPPYMSFQTFWSFIEELASRPLPPQIDRSMMGSKSGTDQANLMSALSSFGLIDNRDGQRNAVLPTLIDLATADTEARPARLATLVRLYYPSQVRLAEQNATEQQLKDSFAEDFMLDSAETKRKAMTFFLHAAGTAGIPLSPHFPKTRPGARPAPNGRARRVRRARTAQASATGDGAASSPPPVPEDRAAKGDTYRVELASGGEVSVVVSVNLFDLTIEDRTFVIDLVDKLKGYERECPAPAASTPSP